jgi:type II secretion system protein E
VLPVSRLGNRLYLAMADPLNVLAVDDVKRTTKLEVSPLIASEKAIVEKLANLDSARSATMEDIIQDAAKQAEEEADAENLEVAQQTTETTDLAQLAASSEEAPVIKLANLILVQAIKDRASDIHIEPFENMVRLRYRIDGGLIDMPPPPKNLQVALASRIKVMSSLDIAERRLPQDGRMRVRVGGRDVDLRVSFLPTVHGEKCVLRVLDKSNLSASMDKLGIDKETFVRFKEAVDAPHGLILVTGPTGSGKTTTLYAALERLNDNTQNIMTVEDPIEYYIDGIGQTQVNTKVEMTFARGLRAILRQDPDVVLIGEIRDLETAQIAVQASLTGHLVLSTLHTNTAAGAITRLRDMGIEPFLLSSSLIGVLAQRLVRVLSPETKQPFAAGEYERRLLNLGPSDPSPTLYRPGRDPTGGYRGRSGIYELIMVDDAMRTMIHDGVSEQQIERHARLSTPSIRDDGRARVLRGETTLEEILRVTRED